MSEIGFTTKNLHSDRQAETGRLSKPEHGALHKPVHHSVAYGYEDAEDLAKVFQGRAAGYAYGRQANPTVDALEYKVNQMENGVGTIAFSTGMAAIGSLLQSLLKAGDHLVSSSFLFGNTNSQLNTYVKMGVEVDFVDITDVTHVESVLKQNTRIVFMETIANPVTQIPDFQKIGQLCHSRGILLVVDNTMTSPYLFQPKNHGAGLVVNSLTKYIGGHGNALGGAITDTGRFDWLNYPNIDEIYKKFEVTHWGLTQLRKKSLRDFGATLAPESAHTLSVGSDTLALRMDRSCHNALALAKTLENHPKVLNVNYPGLKSHPQHAFAREYFRHYGGLMSFELDGEVNCFDFLNRLHVAVSSSNLGDNRTLVIPVAHTIFYEMGPTRRAEMGIPDGMIRVSVGIEDTEDLIDDFVKALDFDQER